MRIVPAIDIIDGKCVRLTQGDYEKKKIYREDPLEVAKEFENAGFQYLHLVDLDGAKAGAVVHLKILENITSNTRLQVDFGGGIKSAADIRAALNAGAAQVNCGSIAVNDPDSFKSWLGSIGPEFLILSADVRNGLVAVSGWQENSGISLDKVIEPFFKAGLSFATVTDIATDGMLSGPNFKLYGYLRRTYPGLHITASGGVSSVEDVKKLKTMGMDGVIIGKALYEGKIKAEELLSLED